MSETHTSAPHRAEASGHAQGDKTNHTYGPPPPHTLIYIIYTPTHVYIPPRSRGPAARPRRPRPGRGSPATARGCGPHPVYVNICRRVGVRGAVPWRVVDCCTYASNPNTHQRTHTHAPDTTPAPCAGGVGTAPCNYRPPVPPDCCHRRRHRLGWQLLSVPWPPPCL